VTIADFGGAQEHGVRFSSGSAGRAVHALAEIGELIEVGRFSLPVAHTFPLAEIAEAHRVIEDGHVRGKVVLSADAAAATVRDPPRQLGYASCRLPTFSSVCRPPAARRATSRRRRRCSRRQAEPSARTSRSASSARPSSASRHHAGIPAVSLIETWFGTGNSGISRHRAVPGSRSRTVLVKSPSLNS